MLQITKHEIKTQQDELIEVQMKPVSTDDEFLSQLSVTESSDVGHENQKGITELYDSRNLNFGQLGAFNIELSSTPLKAEQFDNVGSSGYRNGNSNALSPQQPMPTYSEQIQRDPKCYALSHCTPKPGDNSLTNTNNIKQQDNQMDDKFVKCQSAKPESFPQSSGGPNTSHYNQTCFPYDENAYKCPQPGSIPPGNIHIPVYAGQETRPQHYSGHSQYPPYLGAHFEQPHSYRPQTYYQGFENSQTIRPPHPMSGAWPQHFSPFQPSPYDPYFPNRNVWRTTYGNQHPPESSRPSYDQERPMGTRITARWKGELTEESILKYFQKSRWKGNATISDYFKQKCIVSYDNPIAVTRLLKTSGHKIKSSNLQIEEYEEGDSAESDSDSDSYVSAHDDDGKQDSNVYPTTTLRVTGIPSDVPVGTVSDYFECAGGTLANNPEIEQDDITNMKIYFITYKDREAAKNVAERTDLQLNNRHINVELMKTLPFDNTKYIFKNIPPTNENLEVYWQAVGFSHPIKGGVYHSTEPGVALVSYSDSIDFSDLQKRCRNTPIEGVLLQVEPVRETAIIEVHGLPTTATNDMVKYYFENPSRTYRGDVAENGVTIVKDGFLCYALVQFENPEDSRKVSNHDDHCIGGNKVKTRLHYKALGIIPSYHDSSKPFRIPAPMELDLPHKNIVEFISGNKAQSTKFDEALKDQDAKVTWPSNDATVLVLECLLHPENENVHQRVKDWPKAATNTFANLMKEFDTAEIQMQNEYILEKIRGHLESSHSEVEIETVDKTRIAITGVKRHVDTLQTKLKEIITKAERDYERETSIKQKIHPIKRAQAELLNLTRFEETIKEAIPNIEGISVFEDKVEFKGTEAEITQANESLLIRLGEFEHNTISRSCDVCKVLTACERILKEKFKEEEMELSFDVEDNSITFYATQRGHVQRAIQILDDMIPTLPIDIPESARSMCQLPKWQSFLDDLDDEFGTHLQLLTDDNLKHIDITTISTHMERIQEQVTTFLQDNCISYKKINTKHGVAKVLSLFKTVELAKLEKEFEEHQPKISVHVANNSINIQACQSKMSVIEFELMKIVNGIICEKHVDDVPGIVSFYRDEQKGESGKHLRDIEEKHKCAIEITYDKHKNTKPPALPTEIRSKSEVHPIPSRLYRTGVSTTTERMETVDVDSNRINVQKGRHLKPTKYKINSSTYISNGKNELKTKEGLVVTVKSGEIAKEKVDVIVNSVGTDFNLSKGMVANSLFTAAGEELQAACKLKVPNTLDYGQVCDTTGYKMKNCKHIFHGACRNWSDGASPAKQCLKEYTRNCLEMVHEKKLFSIAFPVLGSGNLKIPEHVVANVMYDTISEFSQKYKTSTVKDVRIIVFPKDTVILQVFEKLIMVLGSGQQPAIETLQPQGKDTMVTENGCKITLKAGSIESEDVDVIVNTTARNLKLDDAGSVSKSILQAAGSQLQEECTKKGSIQFGEILSTNGYKMNCKHVFHSACCNWNDDQGESRKNLRSIISGCLQLASTKKMKSISFPAIGTGGLKIPADIAANIMYDEVAQFSRQSPNSTIKQVHFVVYVKDASTKQGFEKELLKLRNQSSDSSSEDDDDEYEGLQAAGGIYAGVPVGRDVTDDSASDITIKGTRISVVHGDITKESTDAIVNCVYAVELSPSGKVTEAILKEGGAHIFSGSSISDLKTTGVSTTGAGTLSCKSIIHFTPPTDKSFNDKGWKQKFKAVLKIANTKDIKSLSFSAFGTGGRGHTVKDISLVLLKVIYKFCKKNVVSFQQIRIVVFQKEMVPMFTEQLLSLTTGSPAFFNKLGKRVMSAKSDNKEKELRKTLEKAEQEVAEWESITFKIYADSKENANQAINKLRHRKDVDSVDILDTEIEEEEIISELQSEEAKEILDIRIRVPSVQIKIDRAKNRIIMEGRPKHVKVVRKDVKIILHKAKARYEKYKKEVEVMYEKVRWCYRIDEETDDYDPYERDISYKIQKAQDAKLPTFEFSDGLNEYVIHFKTKEQCRIDPITRNVIDKTPIRAADWQKGEGTPHPIGWDFDPGEDKNRCTMKELKKSDPICNRIVQEFEADFSTKPTVVDVYRIQNIGLHKHYETSKNDMEKRNPGTQNERILYHGTSKDAISKINENGIIRNFVGKNAACYGNGTYYAKQATYSAQDKYSTPDTDGFKYIYRVKVLTGRFTLGKTNMKDAPAIDPAKDDTMLYDSVVDKDNDPSLFVIFRDYQSYPEYLIKFKK